jgi:hypothetical protein
MKRNSEPKLVAIDPITANLLIELAEMWGVSEAEAIHRAVEQANASLRSPSREDRLAAFKELQRSLSLTPAKAAEWQKSVREARC